MPSPAHAAFSLSVQLPRIAWNEPRRLTWKNPADPAQPVALPPDTSRAMKGMGSGDSYRGESYMETYC